ncbi:glutathione S-transferase N-terminal domain-containing protein [Roseomonas sp. CCTCC AB2023176]|uniref:glutathione S-transferase N-terminal domain-containing protein n=1 Tax=Roseomonas sp. CCTCC AB2023176 TaxID=3342640 RepID=UPI0035E24F30
MPVLLHDLCGADPTRRFSPYCWRVRMALAHKGIAHETLPWRFTDRAAIADCGAEKVPVLRHNGQAVFESQRILEYLEDTWPDAPTLFAGAGGRATARFVAGWADLITIASAARCVVSDIPRHLAPEDADYFTRTREARYGTTLTALTANREQHVETFRRELHPLRAALRSSPFLSGDNPGAADYIVFGGFQWARVVSDFPLLTQDDPVHAWRARLLDLHGGLARNIPHEDRTA